MRLRKLDPTYRPEEEEMAPQPGTGPKDVFICHASEDKRSVVEPLIRAFDSAGISYWYDRAQIKWGDSLVERIDEGLREARYVLVVLSTQFLAKRWTMKELRAALHLEVTTGKQRVLALLVGDELERKNILEQLPLLAEKLYLTWPGGGVPIASELKKLLEGR
jgi:hypothetical protein